MTATRLLGYLRSWEALIALLLVAALIFGRQQSDIFLTGQTFTNGSLEFTEVALIVMPLVLVIVAAEIDLSVASVVSLSSAVMGWLWNHDVPIEAIIPLCVGVGALCGAFNGFLVTRLGLPSLAVTIGTLTLFKGLAYVVAKESSVTDLPESYTNWSRNTFAGTAVPNTIVLAAIGVVVAGVILHATSLGRRIYAIGANEEAARFTGLRVKRIKLGLFVATGAVAAFAGVLLSLRNSTAAANVGEGGLELTCVAVAVLGGVSIFGGRGTILGVLLALFLLGSVQQAMRLSPDISPYWIPIVTGLLLILSVLVPNVVSTIAGRRRRVALPTQPALIKEPS
jgi:rhamnose transport system permease protein